mgnify:CR=1 FL=1
MNSFKNQYVVVPLVDDFYQQLEKAIEPFDNYKPGRTDQWDGSKFQSQNHKDRSSKSPTQLFKSIGAHGSSGVLKKYIIKGSKTAVYTITITRASSKDKVYSPNLLVQSSSKGLV